MDGALNEVVIKSFSSRLIGVTATYGIKADNTEPRLIPATLPLARRWSLRVCFLSL